MALTSNLLNCINGWQFPRQSEVSVCFVSQQQTCQTHQGPTYNKDKKSRSSSFLIFVDTNLIQRHCLKHVGRKLFRQCTRCLPKTHTHHIHDLRKPLTMKANWCKTRSQQEYNWSSVIKPVAHSEINRNKTLKQPKAALDLFQPH